MYACLAESSGLSRRGHCRFKHQVPKPIRPGPWPNRRQVRRSPNFEASMFPAWRASSFGKCSRIAGNRKSKQALTTLLGSVPFFCYSPYFYAGKTREMQLPDYRSMTAASCRLAVPNESSRPAWVKTKAKAIASRNGHARAESNPPVPSA